MYRTFRVSEAALDVVTLTARLRGPVPTATHNQLSVISELREPRGSRNAQSKPGHIVPEQKYRPSAPATVPAAAAPSVSAQSVRPLAYLI